MLFWCMMRYEWKGGRGGVGQMLPGDIFKAGVPHNHQRETAHHARQLGGPLGWAQNSTPIFIRGDRWVGDCKFRSRCSPTNSTYVCGRVMSTAGSDYKPRRIHPKIPANTMCTARGTAHSFRSHPPKWDRCKRHMCPRELLDCRCSGTLANLKWGTGWPPLNLIAFAWPPPNATVALSGTSGNTAPANAQRSTAAPTSGRRTP